MNHRAVNPKELALWNEDTSIKGKFQYLKHWIEDPTVGIMTLHTEHTTTQANTESVYFGWLTSSGIFWMVYRGIYPPGPL